MKKRLAGAIQVALLLVMISGLTVGCAGLSSATNSPTSALTPPSSQYPVDIIGRVTIANNVIAGKNEYKGEFWLVQTSIRNKAYQTPVTSTADWIIGIESKPDSMVGSSIGNFTQSPVIIPQGQSGEMILCFGVVSGLNPSDYQICLQGYTAKEGQIPDSYGKLVNTGTVAEIYDWDSQRVIQAGKRVLPATNIATLGERGIFVMIAPAEGWGYAIYVDLKPTQSAIAGKVYVVDLYEKGKLRATTHISWNQPEINVQKNRTAAFRASQEEYNAYFMEDVSRIFSVKVHE
jgi:hypothetical protein